MAKQHAQLRKDIVSAARILTQRRLVEGFGHVSARMPDSDLFMITPRVSLALVRPKELLVLNLAGDLVEGSLEPPFETAMHTAIFNARPEVNAITRIHGRAGNIFSVTDTVLTPVHNHGSYFAGGVPVFRRVELISTVELGAGVAASLGKKPAVLLRGNGQVTVGRSIPEAVMMAIYLEETAEIFYGALQVGKPILLEAEESNKGQKETLPPVDMERAWNFFKNRIEP